MHHRRSCDHGVTREGFLSKYFALNSVRRPSVRELCAPEYLALILLSARLSPVLLCTLGEDIHYIIIDPEKTACNLLYVTPMCADQDARGQWTADMLNVKSLDKRQSTSTISEQIEQPSNEC